MKTLTMTAILSITFLSAGAFAGDGHTLISTAPARVENITVMVKNQAWPAPGRISVEPCKLNRCIDV